MKHWLVIYDVRDPKRLRRIAKKMEEYGQRVQKSVFEVEADEKLIDILRSKIRKIIEDEDFVAYFNICERDWQKRMKFGPGDLRMDVEEKPYEIL
jgi:CRISPR-associated protein Cas2